MKNIFISSTFIDMQAERDLVQERVLPALREEARKYGDNVGVIDLRWGVDTSTLETEEGADKVLKVCLDEIDKSHPYMLIFLGERYGTMMRVDQIEKSIRGREDKYTTDDYIKSITALEVEYGALSEKYGELNHCVVCFREPVVHMLDGTEKELYAEHTEEGKSKLEALKERIKNDLGNDDRLITYSCTWDKYARQLVDFKSSGKPLEDVLIMRFKELFRDYWKKYSELSWFEKDQLLVNARREDVLFGFVGHKNAISDYCHFLKEKAGTDKEYSIDISGSKKNRHILIKRNGILLLLGESGTGKTSILFKTEELLREEGANTLVLLCGELENCNNLKDIYRNICFYFEQLMSKKEHKNTEGLSIDEIKEYFMELSENIGKDERVYILVDSIGDIDDFSSDEILIGRNRNVRYIFTSKNEIEKNMIGAPVKEWKNISGLHIGILSKAELEELICAKIARNHKNTYKQIQAAIMEKMHVINPLYVEVIVERLKYIDSEILSTANTEEDIIERCTQICRDIPDDIILASLRVMEYLASRINPQLFEILEYIAISNGGLRIEDIYLIFEQDAQFDMLEVRRFINILECFIYTDGNGFLLFKHDIFKEAILRNIGVDCKKNIYLKIYAYIKTLHSEDYLKQSQGIYYAESLGDFEFLHQLIIESKKDEDNTFLFSCRKILDTGKRYFVLGYLEEYIPIISVDERKEVQKFVCNILKARRGDIITLIALKIWKLYQAIENEDMFKLFCLAVIADEIIPYTSNIDYTTWYKRNHVSSKKYDTGICVRTIYNIINRHRKQLQYRLSEYDIKSWEYHYVKKIVKRWRRCSPFFSEMKMISNFGRMLLKQPLMIRQFYFPRRNKYICRKNIGHNCKNNNSPVIYTDSRSKKNLDLPKIISKELQSEWTDFFIRNGHGEIAKKIYKKMSLSEYIGKERRKVYVPLYKKYINSGKNAILQEQIEGFKWAIDRTIKCIVKENCHMQTCNEVINLYNDMADKLPKDKCMENAIEFFEVVIDFYRDEFVQAKKKVIDYGGERKNQGEKKSIIESIERRTEEAVLSEQFRGLLDKKQEISQTVSEEYIVLLKQEQMQKELQDEGKEDLDDEIFDEEYIEYEGEAEIKTVLENSIKKELFSKALELINILLVFGEIYDKTEQFQKSMSIYFEVIEIGKSTNECCARDICDNGKTLGELLTYDFKKCLEKCNIAIARLTRFIEKQGSVSDKKRLVSIKEGFLRSHKDVRDSVVLLHYEKTEEESLRELFSSYNNIAFAFCDLGLYEEALECLVKNMKGREELYRLCTNDSNLSSLSVAYNNYGWLLCEVERAEEALEYLKKALQYTEELHRKNPAKNTWIALVLRWRNLAKALLKMKQIPEALEYSKKAVELDRELCLKDSTDKAQERVMKSLSVYADVLLADKQIDNAYKVYTEALEYCKFVCDKNDSIPNRRFYVMILKGMYLCLNEQGQEKEAEEYLTLAKKEEKKLYERSGAEKDKLLLEE